MLDRLHDRVDAREQLGARARELVEAVVRERFDEALAATESFEGALELLALWVEEALQEITTEAVQIGAAGARALRDGE